MSLRRTALASALLMTSAPGHRVLLVDDKQPRLPLMDEQEPEQAPAPPQDLKAELEKVPQEVQQLVLDDMEAHPNRYRMLAKKKALRDKGELPHANRNLLTTRVRQVPKIGRNDACPCGSGLKFKRCHENLIR